VAELKLPQLPDRTPIKVTISISPDLHDALREYALAYMDAYGREEPVALSGQSAPCLSLH